MKITLANVKDCNYTGGQSDLTITIKGGKATWKHYGYQWAVEVEAFEQSKWDIKADAQSYCATLTSPSQKGWINEDIFAEVSGVSNMTQQDLLCEAVRKAHVWVCNHI